MHPLNISNYLKCNYMKVLPQVISLALGVFLMYFTCILGGGIKEGIKNAIIEPYQNISDLVFTNLQEETITMEQLKKLPSMENIIYTGSENNATIKVLIDEAGVPVYILKPEDTQKIMNSLKSILIKGKIPDTDGEILINENAAKNYNISIGDYLGNEVDEKQQLSGKFKVVGLYKGITSNFFAYKNYVNDIKNYKHALILISKMGRVADTNKYLQSLEDEKHLVWNINKATNNVGGMFQMFDMFAVIILVIVIFVLTVTIGNINYIHFYDRSPEFSLLQAIGYEKKYIIGRIFMEMYIILFGGFIIGAALSLAGGYLFNLLYCYPKGTPVTIVSKGYFLITFAIPIFVTIFSLLPMLKFLNKMDYIQVLEGK